MSQTGDLREHPKYGAWVREYYPTREAARYRCQEASSRLVVVFPELKRVRGWYGHTEHWWCKTEDGEIVDPTRHQFTRECEYREFREGYDIEPIGKCMNCGNYVWDRDPETREPLPVINEWACSESCFASLRTYYGIRS